MDIEEQLPCIQGNIQKLKQVFINLATNAIDAMPNGGSLTLSAAVSDGNGEPKPKSIEIKVKDTGRGISTQSHDKIFEPFHTTKTNGMGLGLAISQNIIKQHGGNIEVESSQNHGTTFIVKLPV